MAEHPLRAFTAVICLGGLTALAPAEPALRNETYQVDLAPDGDAWVKVAGMPPQRLAPEFTVLWSAEDPHCTRNPSHPNYAVAPRVAVRWRNPGEPLASLNSWLSSPGFQSATGLRGTVREEGKGRAWEFRHALGEVTMNIRGAAALDTTRPFTVGQSVVMKPARCRVSTGQVCWEYPVQNEFALTAELALPPRRDLEFTFILTPKRPAFFSVAFTGAPAMTLGETIPVPQECGARGHKQFDFVMSEADLHLPRAHVAAGMGNVALAADPRECRFRLPTIQDSRFGLLLSSQGGQLKPVLLAPLLGGTESEMREGVPWKFTFSCILRAGDWKSTYAYLARNFYGFRDQRDNSGPGSLNGTLERVMDFLADRHGGNRALWDPQQKYYDYFTDKTGVFKPFSPLYGLGAAIVTDDEELFRTRARPAVEYALSRKTNLFAPYDAADNKQARSATREIGAPYLSREQLLSLHALFQGRSPALGALAAAQAPAKKAPNSSEEGFFNLLEGASATRLPQDIAAAREAAYHNAAKLNLYPPPPDEHVTVDHGGLAPVHAHSFGRHKNLWGFPLPQPVSIPEQTVPAWRIARLGLPGIAYPIEYWMNTHGAMMRVAALAQDEFLRDIARWGMVGRFGNYPGDNRSQPSLVAESPSAVAAPPWQWNFATVNPGHAWDFAGAVLDFLVSDAFERSRGAIDFPALSAAGSQFRVRIYGGHAGTFYGDQNVRLWLPRGLLTSENVQLDWLAGYGNGQLYLAIWNQSFREEKATLSLNGARVQCAADRDARIWRDNQPAPSLRVSGSLSVSLSPKGIVALAIPAVVKPMLQAKLYDSDSGALPEPGFSTLDTPFGQVHAALLRAGRDLTSAFVYTDAPPETIIAAHLRWRQGDGPWQEAIDDIFPYEFSPELRDDAGDFACIFQIEDASQQRICSPLITLAVGEEPPGKPLHSPPPLPPETAHSSDRGAPSDTGEAEILPVSDDFISYLQSAANGSNFGLRSDGRFYPYSTPQGRRIAWRQTVWNKEHYSRGCSRREADQRFRANLGRTLAELKTALAARHPAVDFLCLDPRQRETLLDFAHTGGLAGLQPELVAAVLARDWGRLINHHLYIRYAGHAPDHSRNKAFAQRWNVP